MIGLGSRSIVVQGNDVFVAGLFDNHIFDGPITSGFPLLGTPIGAGSGVFPIFVIKLDATAGTTLAATSVDANVAWQGSSASIAVQGANLYVTGTSSYWVGVNSIGVDKLTTMLVPSWSNSFTGGKSIDADVFGNVYVVGNMVRKLDNLGNIVWTRLINANGIVVDNLGSIYITGDFVGTTAFPAPLTSLGGSDVFVAKLDATSGATIWVKQMGGVGNDISSSIAVDAVGGIYTTGSFSGASNFDPLGTTNGIITTTSTSTDGFISKLDNSGNFVSVKQIRSVAGTVTPNSIAVNAFGTQPSTPNIHLVGNSNSGAYLNFPVITPTSTVGLGDFLAKYTQPCGIITITLPSLMTGVVGTVYNQVLTQTGLAKMVSVGARAAATPIWSVVSGNLPSGLTLSSNGTISGTPTQAGNFCFTVQVSKSPCIQTKSYCITIACGTVTINPTILPDGSVCAPYTQQMSQVGLINNVVWSVTSGVLPAGLTLNSTTGLLSGIPTTTGIFNFTVGASSGICTGTKNYVLVVSCAPAPVVLAFPIIATSCLGQNFNANVTSSNPSAGMITYLSNDTSIATVSPTGDISIVGTGNVCITALQVISGNIGTFAQRCFKAVNCVQQQPNNPALKTLKDEVNLYPNPTDGIFEIEFTKSMDTLFVEVTNVAGKVVLKETFNKKTVLESTNEIIKLDISTLPAGLYLVKWNNGTISGAKKVVKE